MNKKTYQPGEGDIKRNWHLIDAKGKILGRIASKIASLLIGKHKVYFANHLDVGDFVVVINASELKLSGRKMKQKTYKSHSGYPGGFKEFAFEKMIKEAPEKVLMHAVAGMLPDNKLKKKRLARLKVFAKEEHPYEGRFKTGLTS